MSVSSASSLRALLPQGQLLPTVAWQRRHRGIVLFCWVNVALLIGAGLATGKGAGHVLLEASAVAATTAVAGLPGLSRRLRSLASAAALMTAAALLVHLCDGTTEAHFYFFVVIPILALYQDWLPFLFALVYVVVHHVVTGIVDPTALYSSPAAQADPWKWALIHAGFVLAASATCVVSWRGNEQLLHEPLTGLPGRAVFLHAVERACARLRRRPGRVAVLFVDLDRFKLFNDTLGHAFGDGLLVAAAARLRAQVRETDTVARLGGDEFAVLGEQMRSERDVADLAERVRRALEQPFVIDGVEITAGASVGVTSTSADDARAETLIAEADAAMYRAKRGGGSDYVVFDAAMGREDSERIALEIALRSALERDELALAYQPIVRTGDGAVVGVEALLRWTRPDGAAVPPSVFVPLAEQTGLILPLGRWVMEQACREAMRWPTAESGAPYVSVNVSALQFAQPDFVTTVAEVLDATGLPAERLGLELTETALFEDGDAPLDTLESLKRLGVLLLLDDFGTGYSSLAYLQRFPIDTLKVDRSFVAPLGERQSNAQILAAITQLADATGIAVVAEGVETEAQLEVLTELGYAFAQGYHFARPVTPDRLAALLGERVGG